MLAIVAAVGRDNVIGKNNALPWHSPADMRRFRELTTDGTVIMGRLTHESIGRPLPKRRNIIISRNRDYISAGCEIFYSIDTAIAAAKEENIFIIGGEQIYRQTLPLADCLYITEVDKFTPDADAFFPNFDKSDWTATREEHNAETPPITFVTYIKTPTR